MPHNRTKYACNPLICTSYINSFLKSSTLTNDRRLDAPENRSFLKERIIYNMLHFSMLFLLHETLVCMGTIAMPKAIAFG